MARRFRRLRRAAHQVVEVTRRLWRFCLCCGTVRQEINREMIPVSKVLSSESLPRVKRSFLCCHGFTDDDRVCHRVISQTEGLSSFIGPMNRIRPTVSALSSDLNIDPPGALVCEVEIHRAETFMSDFDITSSTTSNERSYGAVANLIDYGNRDLISHTGSNLLTDVHLSTIPIWSVTSRNLTDDHVAFRYLDDLFLHQPVNRQENILRIPLSQNTLEVPRTSSGSLYIEGRFSDLMPSPPRTPPLVSSEDSSVTSLRSGSNTRVTQAMGRVELSPMRRSRYQRFQPDDKYLRYMPTPSGSSLVEVSSRAIRNIGWSNRIFESIHSIPSGSPMGTLRSPTGHLSIDIPGANLPEEFVGNSSFHSSPSSFIGLCGLINSIRCSTQVPNSVITDGIPDRPSVSRRPPSSIVLPGCSRDDPELRLNLPPNTDSRKDFADPHGFCVEIAVKAQWCNVNLDCWNERYTLARTKAGAIDLAYCRTFSQRFVLKSLDPENYKREVQILQHCQSSFVVEMHALLRQGTDKLLCLSYYERLDLGFWLKKDDRRDYFRENHASLICGYILAGLEFIHNKGVLHLNIKPSNILLCSKGYPIISDFASAIRTADDNRNFYMFTPAYASPEIISGQTPTRQADLWATACVFYEIVTNRTPFQGGYTDETQLRILSGAIPDVSMLSPDGQYFICAALRSDKTKRIGYAAGAREMARHRVFHNIGWEEIKYGHRHNDCRLLKVLQDVERAYREKSPPPNTSVCNKNNSGWELWSSSSEDDDSDEEFSISQRPLSVIEEADDWDIRSDHLSNKGHNGNPEDGIVQSENETENIDPG